MILFAAGGGNYFGKDAGTWCAEQGVAKLFTIYNEMNYLRWERNTDFHCKNCFTK